MAGKGNRGQSSDVEGVDGGRADWKWYVYAYRDPDSHKAFYIGKGTDLRVFSHANGHGSESTEAKIREIRGRKKEPEVEIVARNLSEDVAYYVEMALIEFVGIGSLTNKQHGRAFREHGSIAAGQLAGYLGREALAEESFNGCPTVVFRINKLYRTNMTQAELYDATRCCWKVDMANAGKCKYAMCAYEGRILEIYEIAAWFKAGDTFMWRGNVKVPDGRMEFVGRICTDARIRKRFIGKSISKLPKYASQKEFLYFGLDSAGRG